MILALGIKKYAKDNNITEVPIEFLNFCLRETRDITEKMCKRDGVSVADEGYMQFGEHIYRILRRGDET